MKIYAKLCLVLFVVAFLLTNTACTPTFPECKVELKEQAVDNEFHNYLAGGGLVRVGDALYYSYGKNAMEDGLIKISAEGAERVYTSGFSFSARNVWDWSLRTQGNAILLERNQVVHKFSTSTHSVEKDVRPDTLPDALLCYYKTDSVLIYKSYSKRNDSIVDLRGELRVRMTENSQEDKTVAYGVKTFNVSDQTIYYVTSVPAGDQIRKYDMQSESDESVCTLGGGQITALFIDGSNIITRYSGDVVVIDGSEESAMPRSIKTGVSSCNVFHGVVYMTTEQGLYSYNLSTKKEEKLAGLPAKGCYVLDEVWVYFEDTQANLWRVKQDGSYAEKVFPH